MNNDNRLRLSEAKNLFSQALQRQNDRAAGMKMPDDMEQRVMGSLTPNPSPRRGKPSPLPLRRSPLLWRGRGRFQSFNLSIPPLLFQSAKVRIKMKNDE
mgnify:CR=1 FL=1